MGGDRCARHPGARAGWSCRGCGATLCPGCTYVHRAGPAELPACSRCGSFVEPITLHRAELRPFPGRVPATLAWPFSGPGILAILGLGLVQWLLLKFGLVGALLAAGVWWGFVFNVIRRSANGEDELGPPDFSDLFADVVSPALRGIVATAVLWVPAAGYLVASLGAGATLEEAIRDPVVWLLAALGLAYGPAGVLVAAVAGSVGSLLNPLVGLRVIARLGGDYWVAALSVGALLLANAGVKLVAAYVSATGIPVLSGWLAESATCLLPIVAARVLGVLLHVRGDALGFGPPESYLEPALGAAVPRGAQPVLATQAVEAPPEAVAAIALEDAPSPAPPAPEGLAGIAAALAAGDRARAATLYAAYRGPAEALPARTLFEVARAAADAGQHALSARALHAAGTGTDAAVAPNALLVLARIYERRLARPAEARQVLAFLVARWPASDAARAAREALGSAGAA